MMWYWYVIGGFVAFILWMAWEIRHAGTAPDDFDN